MIRKHRFLAYLASLFGGACFHLSIVPEGGGAPADDSKKPKSLEDQLADANGRIQSITKERDDLTTRITNITGERDQARSERDSARTDLKAAQDSVTTITGERDQLKNDLTTARSTISTLTTERDTANTNLQRLEKYAGIHGLKLEDAPKIESALQNPGGATTIETLQEQFAKETDGNKRAHLASQIRKLRDKQKQD